LWSTNSDEKSSDGRHKYKFEIAGDEDTKFVMISDDPMEIQIKLANLIREPRKFICLNDNIDYKLRTEATQLKSVIRNYFTGMLPIKSSYELRDNANGEQNSNIPNRSHVEFSSWSNKGKSNEVTDGYKFATVTAAPNSQRMFFFLPILVAVFILCFYFAKKLLLNDDEASAMERGRGGSGNRLFGGRFGLTRRTPTGKSSQASAALLAKKLDASDTKKHKMSNALRRKLEEAEFSSDSDLNGDDTKLSDETELSTSSSANHSRLSSTLNNETGKKGVSYGGAREGLVRKKKSTVNKKLNITTI
jgi:hypothetical protein